MPSDEVLGAIIGALIAGTILLVLEFYLRPRFSKPKPEAECLGVSIGPRPSDQKKSVKIPLEVDISIAENPVLTSLPWKNEKMRIVSFQDLEDYATINRQSLAEYSQVLEFLHDMRERLKSYPPSMDRAERRLEFLKSWAKYEFIFGSNAKGVIKSQMSVGFDQRYTTPVSQDNRNDCPQILDLGSSFIDLNELDEDKIAEKAAPEKRDQILFSVQATNILRRHFIHFDEVHLDMLLSKMEEQLSIEVADAKSIGQSIKGLLKQEATEFILSNIFITNSGSTSPGVRSRAILELRVSESQCHLIPMQLVRQAQGSTGLTVIESGKMVDLQFHSTDPLSIGRWKNIHSDEDISGTKVQTHFDSGGAKAVLHIKLGGFKSAPQEIISTDAISFCPDEEHVKIADISKLIESGHSH